MYTDKRLNDSGLSFSLVAILLLLAAGVAIYFSAARIASIYTHHVYMDQSKDCKAIYKVTRQGEYLLPCEALESLSSYQTVWVSSNYKP